jgi:hypothetical protein
MSGIKLFFDNCIGPPISKSIGGVLCYHSLNPKVKHLKDFFDESIKDDEWIPQIAKDSWIIITADRAKKYGGPKLPAICKKFNVTHILISGKLHNAPQFEKARAIISLFPRIIYYASKGPPGSRFSMRYTGSDKSLTLQKK